MRPTGASRAEIEGLYRERYAAFRRTLAPLTGSYEAAHDVVQETFARALAERRRFRGDAPLAAWVWQIAMRVVSDERRRCARRPVEELLDEGLVDPARDVELSQALLRLPPRRRLIFFLRYFGGFSYREIAAICDISEGTVAATIAQARNALVQALGEEVGDVRLRS
jgi:RNA polymerase sigma-70 factor (ECF subfamily)